MNGKSSPRFGLLSDFSTQMISGKWLNKKRLQVYPRLFLAVSAAAIIFIIATSSGNLDWSGKPIGTDFCAFYAAGSLALEGSAANAYDPNLLYLKEKEVIGSSKIDYYTFTYPPIFLLILTPLAYFPYLASLGLWLCATIIFYVLMLRKLSASNKAIVLALAFPATFLTIGHGQNAFLTTALLAGMLYYLDLRPVVAGILLGLLTFKPHLGVVIPIVLIATGQWRVMVIATLTAVALVGISMVSFGYETWQAFFTTNALALKILNEGLLPYHKMQSLFASLRLMGISVSAAYILQLIYALLTTCVVVWIWTQPISHLLKKAALATSILMVTPFLLDYDLTIISITIACLSVYGFKYDFREVPVNLLAIAWLSPILFRIINEAAPFPWAQLLLSILLFKIFSIARASHLSDPRKEKASHRQVKLGH